MQLLRSPDISFFGAPPAPKKLFQQRHYHRPTSGPTVDVSHGLRQRPWRGRLCTSILEGAVWVARVSPNLPCASRGENIEYPPGAKMRAGNALHTATHQDFVNCRSPDHELPSCGQLLEQLLHRAKTACEAPVYHTQQDHFASTQRASRSGLSWASSPRIQVRISEIAIPMEERIPSAQRSLAQICRYASQKLERSS